MADTHKGFCLKSIKCNIPNVDIPITDNFDFIGALESVYPLLEMVFEFLNYNDLRMCCEVKKSWRDLAEKVLNKRTEPSWFTCYKTKYKTRNVFKYSENLNYNNVGMGIILYDYRRIKRNRYICVHTNTSELSRKSVPEYLQDELVPRDIDYCLISCPKVNSYFDPKSKNIEDLSQASLLDGVFIPKIKNIRTSMFYCNPDKKESIRKSLEPYIKNNEEVKCLLMFAKSDLNKSLQNLLMHLIPENEASSVAVGGGIIRGTKSFLLANTSKMVNTINDAFCITFLRDRNTQADFNAFSFVIYGGDLSKEEFSLELSKFRKRIRLRKNSVAIRVCCSAKVDTDEEPVSFNRVFPNLPLLSFTADGEIGWDCLSIHTDNELGESKAKKSKQKYPRYHHQWSTVFVIITWGQS